MRDDTGRSMHVRFALEKSHWLPQRTPRSYRRRLFRLTLHGAARLLQPNKQKTHQLRRRKYDGKIPAIPQQPLQKANKSHHEQARNGGLQRSVYATFCKQIRWTPPTQPLMQNNLGSLIWEVMDIKCAIFAITSWQAKDSL